MANNDDEKSLIQRACEAAEIPVRSYSGRGMYGTECLGAEPSDVGALFAAVLEQIDRWNYGASGKEDLDVIADAFRKMRTDSMGRGVIIYFPGVSYVQEYEDSSIDEEPCEDFARGT